MIFLDPRNQRPAIAQVGVRFRFLWETSESKIAVNKQKISKTISEKSEVSAIAKVEEPAMPFQKGKHNH
jgi:hypothetical protein